MPVKVMKLTRMGHQSPEKRDLFQRIHSGAREPREPEPGPLSLYLATFGPETDPRQDDSENEASDPTDTAQD